jgi:hypothetical protein
MVSLPALGATPDTARTITYGWLQHVVGFTFCLNGQGHTFISPNQSFLDLVDTDAHEAKHREQMQALTRAAKPLTNRPTRSRGRF